MLSKLSIYLPGNTFNATPGATNTPSLYYDVNYTDLNQLRSKSTYNGSTKIFEQARNYINLGAGRRTNQVWFLNYRDSSGNLIWGRAYGYDAYGNISTEGVSNPAGGSTPLYSYVYDKQNQLTGVNGANGTALYAYSYDSAGNIRSASNGSTTHIYSYNDVAWADLLTAYDGETITYDAVGNPLSYYNGSWYSFTWQKGRQLASANVGSTSVSYTYDMAGVRSSKTVNGTTYNYTTLSGLVVRQEWDGKSIDFIYDDANQPYLMRYKSSANATPVTYYFILNVQGDVMAIMDDSAAIVAQY